MNINYQQEYIDEIIVNSINKMNKHIINTTKGYDFDEDGECPITMRFYDGIAVATDNSGLVMTYPTIDQVTHSVKMQYAIFDSTWTTEINQFDVALALGKLKKYNMVAGYNAWIKQDDNAKIDITAIHDTNGKFLFDVLENDYEQMVIDKLVECEMLCKKLSRQSIDRLQIKYGILWTDCIKDEKKKPES